MEVGVTRVTLPWKRLKTASVGLGAVELDQGLALGGNLEGGKLAAKKATATGRNPTSANPRQPVAFQRFAGDIFVQFSDIVRT